MMVVITQNLPYNASLRFLGKIEERKDALLYYLFTISPG